MYVGGARTTFGNVALRVESELSWAARSGRPFPEGLPCLCREATTKLAPHTSPGVLLADPSWERSQPARTTPGEGRDAVFLGVPFEF